MSPTNRDSKPTLALALAGGNALGAYEAGAYEALHGRGYFPDLISGASIGAINGAIIAGNAPQQRLAKLREFWSQADSGGTFAPQDEGAAQHRACAADVDGRAS